MFIHTKLHWGVLCCVYSAQWNSVAQLKMWARLKRWVFLLLKFALLHPFAHQWYFLAPNLSLINFKINITIFVFELKLTWFCTKSTYIFQSLFYDFKFVFLLPSLLTCAIPFFTFCTTSMSLSLFLWIQLIKKWNMILIQGLL